MTGRSIVLEIATGAGPARVDLDIVAGDQLLVIGHGAGGEVSAPDLLAVRQACLARGISVARVTQPYRVAGRRAPPAAAVLDRAWTEVCQVLRRRTALTSKAVFFGGRSSGARVACRCATAAAAGGPGGGPAGRQLAGVLALAFPVHPPGKPEKSRLAELLSVPVPVLVIQGDRDPFGHPGPVPPPGLAEPSGRTRLSGESAALWTVATVRGDHSLRQSAPEVGQLVADWIGCIGLRSNLN